VAKKTIKQSADELGVSKTTVRKYLTGEVKTKFSKVVSGVILIDEQGEQLIKSAFLNQKPQTKVSLVSEKQFSEVSTIISVLKSTINALQGQLIVKDGQLESKDKQISELTVALQSTTEALKAAQALHAGTLQNQLEQNENKAVEDKLTPADGRKSKKHWWQWQK
jgi:predicted transcriptional regulator